MYLSKAEKKLMIKRGQDQVRGTSLAFVGRQSCRKEEGKERRLGGREVIVVRIALSSGVVCLTVASVVVTGHWTTALAQAPIPSWDSSCCSLGAADEVQYSSSGSHTRSA